MVFSRILILLFTYNFAAYGFSCTKEDIKSSEDFWYCFIKQFVEKKFTQTKQTLNRPLCHPQDPSQDYLDSTRSCISFYQNFYEQEETRIDLFLGFYDNQDFLNATDEEKKRRLELNPFLDELEDYNVKRAISRKLQKRCRRTSSSMLCGFKKTEKGFTKTIDGPLGVKKNIILKLHSPSLSPYINGSLPQEVQEQNSEKVRSKYFQAINESDALFYLGHARYGSGDWFRPLPKGIEMGWSYLFEPEYKKMLFEIAKSKTPPKVIGLYGCDMADYYAEGFKFASPNSALIISKDRELTLGKVLHSALASINGLLNLKCEEDLKKDIESATDKAEESFLMEVFK